MILKPISKWVLWVVLGATGCGHTSVSHFSTAAPAGAAIQTVAVLPFENLTPTAEAGEVVSDLLITELHDLQRFKILGKLELAPVFSQKNIQLPKKIDRAIAAEIGRKVGADGVFIGSVSEYVYRAGSNPDDEKEPAVGFNVRLINTQTGTVVWGASMSRSSYEVFAYEKDSLTRVAMKAVEKMLRSLKNI